jgi:hypothetical protein
MTIKKINDKSGNICPISGSIGKVRRKKRGEEIFNLYEKYFGKKIDNKYYSIPFDEEIKEYISPKSGLIWYHPCLLGNGEYYAHLSKVYSWYYNPSSWDKIKALDEIKKIQPDWVVEVGSGSGWLLSEVKKLKIPALGVELNSEMVSICKSEGLAVFGINDQIEVPNGEGVLCMLQTLEHLETPLETLTEYINKFKPAWLILSAPCHESILGHTSDPLSWPPHHFTAWSEKSFRLIGAKISYNVKKINYSPLDFSELEERLSREGRRKLLNISFFPVGSLGRFVFNLRQKLGVGWACRGHSILGVYHKK